MLFRSVDHGHRVGRGITRPLTAGHQGRVADLAAEIAAALGLGVHETEGIRLAARINDIGKIAVPAEILNKPGRLSPPSSRSPASMPKPVTTSSRGSTSPGPSPR